MSEQTGKFIPLHVWFIIVRHLAAQDVLNASITCRHWYKGLAHQQVWEIVFRTILPGYPGNHFLIPHLVENIKRLDFIPLDESEPQFLDHWSQSWKQRTVYLQHIIYVQSSVVKALRARTKSFDVDVDDAVNPVSKIREMEEYLESALPIDLVLFMFHFAHHLLVRQPEQDMEVVMPLASGAQFETKDKWRKLIDKLDIQHFHEKCEVDNATQMKNMSHTTENFFLQLRIAPFAQYTQYEYEFELNDQRGVLSVMLSKNSLLPPDLPGHIANKVYQVNFENMENGAGKVFFALVNSYSELEMTYVSESFTDYLIQYTGVALEYGEVPRQGSYGVNDLVVPLPRDQKPRQSILLPQPIDWDIGSYFPTYFTQEPDNSGLFLFDAIDRHYNLKKIRQSPVPTFDNPTGIPFEHPPLELFGGMKNMNWKPYHDLLATRYPISTLNRLIDFGSGRRPIRHEVEFNQDIYDLLPHMAQEWIASTQSTIDTSRLVSEADIEQIGQKTMKLRELFQLHQQYLPICLYYRNFMSGLEYIETEKYFQDHLNGVNIGIPKYSSQDLDIISDRLNYQLTFLTGYIERLPLRSSLLKISNKYLNNSFAVTWKHLE